MTWEVNGKARHVRCINGFTFQMAQSIGETPGPIVQPVQYRASLHLCPAAGQMMDTVEQRKYANHSSTTLQRVIVSPSCVRASDQRMTRRENARTKRMGIRQRLSGGLVLYVVDVGMGNNVATGQIPPKLLVGLRSWHDGIPID